MIEQTLRGVVANVGLNRSDVLPYGRNVAVQIHSQHSSSFSLLKNTFLAIFMNTESTSAPPLKRKRVVTACLECYRSVFYDQARLDGFRSNHVTDESRRCLTDQMELTTSLTLIYSSVIGKGRAKTA